MKKILKTFLIISILLIGIFTLTGCSEDNSKDTETTKSSSSKTSVNKKKTEAEIKADIEKEVLGITKSGDYVIKLKNNNDTQVYIEDVSVRFFDNEGNFVKKENADDSYFCIPANSEIITYVWGYEENFEQYASSEIELMLGNPFYEYRTENFEIKSNDTNDEIAVTITNNNDIELDCIRINVVFFNGDSVVGIESGISYEEGIQPNGGKAYINVDYPLNSDYNEVSFDSFEVYLTSAYQE